MAQSIFQLPDEVVNQIAAGEVVERPASAAKELVENSLDAGATTITVTFESGGKSLLRVADDGNGMPPEDLGICYLRHTTSKLRKADDLFVLKTAGFRGEALSSIAAVSRMTVETRTEMTETGLRLVLTAGIPGDIEEIARGKGTTVTVEDLFWNTPVRKTFLGADTYEASRIADIVCRLALANPDRRFVMRNGSREILSAIPGSLATRASEVLGDTLSSTLTPVDFTSADGIRVHGRISAPDAIRGRRNQSYLYLERRPIWNAAIQRSVLKAYDPWIAAGEQPVSILFLELPAGAFDINVHPAKREVRFSEEGQVFSAVYHAVRSALEKASSGPVIHLGGFSAQTTSASTHSAPAAIVADSPSSPEATASAHSVKPHPLSTPLPSGTVQQAMPPEALTPKPVPPLPEIRRMEAEPQDLFSLPEAGKVIPLQPHLSVPKPDMAPVPGARFFQLARTYILSEDAQGVVIVDQNAAHQRVLYQKALDTLHANGAAQDSQELLFPELVDLSPTEAELLRPRIAELSRLGFHLEPFGGSTFQMRGIPAHLPQSRSESVLRAILSDLVETTEDPLLTVAKAWASHACFQKGDELDQEQMNALIDSLFATQEPLQSPGGRPTVLRLATAELDRKFGR